jgi:hypothetical protein
LVDVGVYGGVEAGEGVVAGDVGAVALVDIVLVVLLADRVNPREDVDHGHPGAPIAPTTSEFEKRFAAEGGEARRRIRPRLGGLHRRFHERLQVKPSQTFILGSASRVKSVLKLSAVYTGKVKS